MKKRQSVFVNLAVGFVVFYSFYTAGFFAYYVIRAYSRDKQTQIANAANYAQVAKVLLREIELGNNTVEDLELRLDMALETSQIHFYSLRKNGNPVIYANLATADDQVEIPVENGLEGDHSTKTHSFRLEQVGPYTFIVGHKTDLNFWFEDFWRREQDVILKDLVLILAGMLGLVFYAFRDFRSLVSKMSKRGASRGDLNLATSAETLTLVRGIKGYESKVEALSRQHQLFRSQVLPALRKELESGKKPPYEFGCTLARTDINNFTSIFTSEKREHFMEAIDDFFFGVTHIVSRYGGYVYEFVGDEVLYYFKDDEHSNSAAIAISALRDINELAMRLSERTTAEADYDFRVKSSLAHGVLHFGPLVDGFALAGPPLIETVRMLSHIHEKSENVVLFDETLAQRVSFLCRSKSDQVVMLKGFQGHRRLHRYEAHAPLSLHLRQSNEASFENATYYRSDESIQEILEFVSLSVGSVSANSLNKLVGDFKKYKVTTSSRLIKKSYLELAELLRTFPKSEEVDFLYATTISSAPHLLTPDDWNGPLRKLLLKSLEDSNRRVVANTLDVFAELDPNAGEEIFKKLMQISDNRIAANLLIKEGKREWSQRTAKKLEKMLGVQSAFFKSSALYAIGEIATHIKSTDEVAFSAESSLQKLIQRLPSFVTHANAMVRRQAIKALQKLALERELEEILQTTTGLSLEVRVELQQALSKGDSTVVSIGKSKAG